jgi:hypothetical protein
MFFGIPSNWRVIFLCTDKYKRLAMPLSWNEIKSRSLAFSKQWEHECSEDAEAKSFWDGFFGVFGISRKRVASFEEPVKKLGNKQGFIDLFWKGVLRDSNQPSLNSDLKGE